LLSISISIVRFHFSKAAFTKMIKKFHLGKYFRANGSAVVVVLSSLLRQYLAIPLLRAEDMRAEVLRLEAEIKAATLPPKVTKEDRRNFNRFHQYFVRTWMIGMGPNTISVYQGIQKTNNVIER